MIEDDEDLIGPGDHDEELAGPDANDWQGEPDPLDPGATDPNATDDDPNAVDAALSDRGDVSETVDQPTEEMFALEARLRDGDDVPALDPAVRAALLESDEPADSAQPPLGPGSEPPIDEDEPSEVSQGISGEHTEAPGGHDSGGQPTDESGVVADHEEDTGTEEWELPTEAEITAEETAVLVEAARNEVHEAVEHARRTGQPWDPPRPPRSGDFQEPAKRPRYWWRFLLATLIIVLSFGGATSASVMRVFNGIAEDLSLPPKKQLPSWLVEDSNGGPQTIVIIGSDARTGGGAPEDDPGRSDTTILLRLDPDSGQIAMLSIPRDLKVEIPGHGVDKFNAAYSYGGTELTLKTIKQVTGLKVNHVINVDFQGFAMLVDAVGCVFIDVDRDYFNSNEGKAVSEMYAEIDIDAGYQKLCGPDALEYARYRHTDSDLARSSRQQDLLGEVRNRLSFSEIISRRDELIRAFTENATSDITGGDQILELIRLLFDSRDARVVEVKFPATFTMDNGVSYVEATQAEIDGAVDQFLGFEDTAGPIGRLDEGEGRKSAAKKRKARQIRKARKKQKRAAGTTTRAPSKENDGLIDASQGGMDLAAQLRGEFVIHDLPIFYTKRLPEGTIYADGSRAYHLRDLDKNPHKAYRMVMALQKDDGVHYFGLQGIHGWQDPPILEAPHDEITMDGREYRVYSEGDRVRLVSWFHQGNTYWVSNSILLTLTNEQMLGMARAARPFTPDG